MTQVIVKPFLGGFATVLSCVSMILALGVAAMCDLVACLTIHELTGPPRNQRASVSGHGPTTVTRPIKGQ